jgi:hypothetical protein
VQGAILLIHEIRTVFNSDKIKGITITMGDLRRDSVLTDMMKTIEDAIKVWNQGKVLFVDKPEHESGYIQVINSDGEVIYFLPIDKGTQLSYILNVADGYYMITTVVQSGIYTDKIMIN